MPETIPIDGHVHLHDCFDAIEFLSAAAVNMCVHMDASAGGAMGILCLVDSSGSDGFDRLGELATAEKLGRWRLVSTDEVESMGLTDGDRLIFVVAGRQLSTSERLEVLAIGTAHSFPPTRSLRDTVQQVIEAGGIPVVPWGFGKWWLGRGSLVRDLCDSEVAEHLFLGDNGNRPRGFGEPALLKWARFRGIMILPGSDPFPYAKELERVGSYGFKLSAAVSRERPAASLKAHLRLLRTQPETYGCLAGFGAFVRSQLRMQQGRFLARFP